MNLTHIANPVRVNAATILEVTKIDESDLNLMLRLSDGRNLEVFSDMTARITPVPGDYLVTQEDGYEYLNPKDVFERKYSAIAAAPTGVLPPHQQRVIDESADLGDKIKKLANFLVTPVFAGLDVAEKNRLVKQNTAMWAYFEILVERINAFGPGPNFVQPKTSGTVELGTEAAARGDWDAS